MFYKTKYHHGIMISTSLSENNVIKNKVIKTLQLIYDPEIPVNIWDLGLIYNIDICVPELHIRMTLTSATCPASDIIVRNIHTKIVENIKEIDTVKVELVWTPRWNRNLMTQEAKFTLDLL